MTQNMRTQNMPVTDDRAKGRYEVKTGSGVAFSAYRKDGDTYTFDHTEVPEDAEGQGVGTALVRGALDDVRAQGGKVIPECPFVASFIQDHPEYRDLVPPEGLDALNQ